MMATTTIAIAFTTHHSYLRHRRPERRLQTPVARSCTPPSPRSARSRSSRPRPPRVRAHGQAYLVKTSPSASTVERGRATGSGERDGVCPLTSCRRGRLVYRQRRGEYDKCEVTDHSGAVASTCEVSSIRTSSTWTGTTWMRVNVCPTSTASLRGRTEETNEQIRSTARRKSSATPPRNPFPAVQSVNACSFEPGIRGAFH